jgi:ABC-type branched-subunit amino acid transport system substrate-binding protein
VFRPGSRKYCRQSLRVRVRRDAPNSEITLPTGDSTAPKPDRPTPPRDPARTRRDVTGRALLVVGGAVIVVLAGAVALSLSPPVKKIDRLVDEVLAPSAVPRGISDTEIVLGMASAFSGANRELGNGMRAGVEAALGEVNARGGVHGRRLRLVAVDDGYEPSRTLPAMRQLVEKDRVFAVVGNMGTPTAAVSIPYCQHQHVIFFGALSGGDLLRRTPPDRYVFNVRPSYAQETAAAVRWLAGARRIAPGRIAVFAQEDEFGESGWRGAAEELRARGVDPAGVLRVGYRRNTAEVREAVAKLKERARGVDAVVMIATYQAAAAFVRKLREAGLRQLTTNVSAVDSDALAEELAGDGKSFTEGVFVTQIVPLPTAHIPGVTHFQEAMAHHGGGARAGFVALEGYLAAEVFIEALRRAGRELDTEKLVGVLEELRHLDLGIGARMSFAPDNHTGSRQVWGTLLQPDGSWRQVALE